MDQEECVFGVTDSARQNHVFDLTTSAGVDDDHVGILGIDLLLDARHSRRQNRILENRVMPITREGHDLDIFAPLDVRGVLEDEADLEVAVVLFLAEGKGSVVVPQHCQGIALLLILALLVESSAPVVAGSGHCRCWGWFFLPLAVVGCSRWRGKFFL